MVLTLFCCCTLRHCFCWPATLLPLNRDNSFVIPCQKKRRIIEKQRRWFANSCRHTHANGQLDSVDGFRMSSFPPPPSVEGATSQELFEHSMAFSSYLAICGNLRNMFSRNPPHHGRRMRMRRTSEEGAVSLEEVT